MVAIRSILQSLDSHKAHGPDGSYISARFLKETSEHIAPVLPL